LMLRTSATTTIVGDSARPSPKPVILNSIDEILLGAPPQRVTTRAD
jgi:hypothetical protein